MLAKISQFIKFYQAPLLSGLLIGTSYIPFPPWASLFCMVPLWAFWYQHMAEKPFRLFFSGWITGFVLTCIGFNWVTYTIHEFGHFPWPLAFLGFLLFCGFANLDLAISGFTLALIHQKWKLPKAFTVLLFPIITAIYEAHIPSIFEWNYGYTFYWAGLPLYHLAELIGFQGLSAVVIILNLLVFQAFVFKSQRRARLLVLVVTFFVLNMAGWGLSKSLEAPDEKIRVGIVQANIGNLEKQFAEQGRGFRDHILRQYTDLTTKLLQEDGALDFVLWPETAFPATIFDDGYGDHHVQGLQAFIRRVETPLITGGYGYEPQSRKPKNAIFLFDQSGQILPQHYFKTHLLAFGEYIPGVETFPKLREWIPASEFARGPGPKVIEFGDILIGLQICYESLFPHFTVALADSSAEVIVNVTNDSWYGTWQEPYQHMMMTLARAVEVRRPLLRATNTGISTVVLASGEVLEKSPLTEPWQGSFEVPFKRSPTATLYQKFPWLMDGLLLLSLLIILWRGSIGHTERP